MFGSFDSWVSYASDVVSSLEQTVGDALTATQNAVAPTLAVVTSEFSLLQSELESTAERVSNGVEEKAPAPNPLPWAVQSEDKSIVEAELKSRILAFSQDERVFTVNAPDDDIFQFRYEVALKYALGALEHDEALNQIRYHLVPKFVKEPQFWRNYFYRVASLREQMKVEPLVLIDDSPSPSNESSSSAINLNESANIAFTDIQAPASSLTPRSEAQSASTPQSASISNSSSSSSVSISSSSPSVSTPSSSREKSGSSASATPSSSSSSHTTASATSAAELLRRHSADLESMSEEKRLRAKQLEEELSADLDLADLQSLVADVPEDQEDELDDLTIDKTMKELKLND